MEVELFHHTSCYRTHGNRNLQIALFLLLRSDDYLAQSLAVLLHHHVEAVVVRTLCHGVVAYISKGEFLPWADGDAKLTVHVGLHILSSAVNHHARQSLALFVCHLAIHGVHTHCLASYGIAVWQIVSPKLTAESSLRQ